jgi:hypothetical protein
MADISADHRISIMAAGVDIDRTVGREVIRMIRQYPAVTAQEPSLWAWAFNASANRGFRIQ